VSSNKSEQSLHIEPRKSAKLALALLALHGAAMSVLLCLPINEWFKFALAGSVVGLLVGSWQIYVSGHSKKSIKLMVWHEDGKWTLITDEQKSIEVDLMPSSFAFPQFIVLKFLTEQGRKYSSIILPDALSASTFHKLFLRLKFEVGH